MNDIIEIELSKYKLLKTLLGSAVFVVIGIMFMLYPNEYTSPIMRNTLVIKIAGTVCLLFFWYMYVFYIKETL